MNYVRTGFFGPRTTDDGQILNSRISTVDRGPLTVVPNCATALSSYKVTAAFPREELFGLTSQLRRASYSTPNNIVEGSAYDSNKQYLKHLYIAASSLTEAEYLLLLCHDLGYLTNKQYNELRKEVKTIHAPLHGLIKAVQKETRTLGNIVALIASTVTIVGTRCITG